MIEGLVMPYRAKAGELLERWREAERQFDVAGEAEQRIELHTEMARLRAEYQEVFKAAHAAKMPEPPPFLSNMPEPGKPTKTFSVGEWLAGQLGCPADELLLVSPRTIEPNSFETWMFTRAGSDTHGAIVITRARLGFRGVTAVWGTDGMANTSIGANDVVRW
jgi:hypothetical protein